MSSNIIGSTEIAPAIGLPEFLTKPLTLPEKFSYKFARHAQSFLCIVFRPLFHLIFKIRVNGKENLKDFPTSSIVVTNHYGIYDSLLFTLVLRPYAPQLPLRYTAINIFDNKFLRTLNSVKLISFIYALFGVLIVTPGAGLDKNLQESKRVLAHNQSVVIYPEGGLNKSGALLPFKRGAAALAVATEKDIFPIVFKIIKRPWKRSEMRINIGRPFKLERNLNYEKGTEVIYQKVNELFVK